MSPVETDGAIRVTVRVGHGLRHRVDGAPEREMRVPAGTLISQLIAELGLAPGEVSIISRQGKLTAPAEVLQDGDEVELYPPIGGGC